MVEEIGKCLRFRIRRNECVVEGLKWCEWDMDNVSEVDCCVKGEK